MTKYWNFKNLIFWGVGDDWGQMTTYLDYNWKNVNIYVWTSAMIMVCTSIECGNYWYEGQIVKTKKLKMLGMVRCSKVIIILCHISKKHSEKIHIMYFLISKEIFVNVLTLVANFLSWRFDKVKIINWKVDPNLGRGWGVILPLFIFP